MNILVPDSWLREFLKTDASPKQIGEYLSLCGQSVEKITKVADDFIYEIEITTNRPDCLSVYGIARELSAILPRFGIKAVIDNRHSGEAEGRLQNRFWTSQNDDSIKNLPLEVKITDSSLCPRFTAIIFENIRVGPSPKIVQERLVRVGSRPLNNVVDISNYLMFSLGQPIHTFDYDKIRKSKMILRQAQTKEKIITLDGQTRVLPAGAIVIEDGDGRIIDLCGIMGAENSAVDEKTKRVLLFVQIYDPAIIRRTCQLLSFRTEAAARFEKGMEPEGVMATMAEAIPMFEKNCGGRLAGKLTDIYPNPPKKKIINLDLNLANKIVGVEITKKEIIEILESLGFSVIDQSSSIIRCTVPYWRTNDVSIPEDLIEEIARIWGYHRLPSNLPPVSIPGIGRPKFRELQTPSFFWEEKVKNFLKYTGFVETVTYSMVSEELLKKTNFDPDDYLKIANPLSEDFTLMRPSLIPSLLNIFYQNQSNFSDIKIFEIANTYLPAGEHRLPEEIRMFSGGQTGDKQSFSSNKFFEVKGVLEGLFEDLGITNYKFTSFSSNLKLFNPEKLAQILINGKPAGFLGEIDKKVGHRFEIAGKVVLFDIEFNLLANNASPVKKYVPLPSYPATVEDLAFIINSNIEVANLLETIKSVNELIMDVKLLDSFGKTRTFRIVYQSSVKTLSKEEVNKIREKIIKEVGKKFGARLKE